jgi:hypothetical protein
MVAVNRFYDAAQFSLLQGEGNILNLLDELPFMDKTVIAAFNFIGIFRIVVCYFPEILSGF